MRASSAMVFNDQAVPIRRDRVAIEVRRIDRRAERDGEIVLIRAGRVIELIDERERVSACRRVQREREDRVPGASRGCECVGARVQAHRIRHRHTAAAQRRQAVRRERISQSLVRARLEERA